MKKYVILFNFFVLYACGTYTIPPRLDNLGNTCYLNSTVQCLYNIDYMTNYVLFSHRVNPYPAGSLANLYLKFVYAINKLPNEQSPHYIDATEKMWNDELHNFVQKASDVMGGICRQHDAHEFFVELVDSLVSQDSRYQATMPEEQLRKHPLGKTLKIEHSTTLECPNVNYHKTKKEASSSLNVPTHIFDESGQEQLFTTLEACLNDFYKKETNIEFTPVGHPIQYNCTKKYEIAELSDIVIIVLNRFTYDIVRDEPIRLGHEITMPFTISFRKYLTPSARNKTIYKYDLISVAEHIGGTRGGHYIAHVKESKSNQWYTCNDSTITLVRPEDIIDNINKSYVFVYLKNKKKPDIPPRTIRRPRRIVVQRETALIQKLQELTKALKNLSSILQ